MQCLDFYSQFLHNPSLLAQGHQLIRTYLQQSQTNRQATLLNLFVQSPPVLTLVSHVYATDVYPYLDINEKTKTREYLISGLWKELGRAGQGKGLGRLGIGLLAMIRKMHNEEGYDQWLGLYSQLIQNTPKQHLPSLLISILEYSDPRISPLSTQIFCHMIVHGQKTSATQQQLLQIFYYCLRSFAHLTGTDDATLQKYFVPYQQQLLAFVWGFMERSPVAMKFGFKILTILYGQMNRFGESDEKIVPKLMCLGMQLTQQYINRLTHPNFLPNYPQYQLQNQQQNTLDLQLPQILSQYLQLSQILLQNSQTHPIQLPILLISIMLCLPTKSQLIFWNTNTDQYLISIQDQYERTIRNRANLIIIKLIQNVDNKDRVCEDLRVYFGVVGMVVGKGEGDVVGLQEYVDKRNGTGVRLVLPNDIFSIQQSSYFILASTLQTLYPQSSSILQYLCTRQKSCNQILLKISIGFILQNQLRQSNRTQLINHIFESINNQKSIYQRKQDIGYALVLARAIGKIGSNSHILIGANFKPQFIAVLVQYLGGNRDIKPDQDGTHIILQLLLKLTQCHPNNKTTLSNYITPQLQSYMLTHYMHDGLLSSLVLRILQQYPHKQTINTISNILMTGQLVEQKYSELITKWMKQQILQLNNTHILKLLQLYTNKKRQVIIPILRYYLHLAKNNCGLITGQIKGLLNFNTQEVLLVPLIKCGVLEDVQAKVVACASNVAFQETSQYEIQRKIVILLYVGIYQTKNFRAVLSKQPNLYQTLTQKLLRYSPLFKGQHLRLLTSIWWLKLAQIDNSLINKISPILKSYGQIQVNEWQDEQNMIDNEQGEQEQEQEQDMLQKLLNCKIENDEVQKQLYQIFGEFIDGGVGSLFVSQRKELYGI